MDFNNYNVIIQSMVLVFEKKIIYIDLLFSFTLPKCTNIYTDVY